jgi:putative ABC transport system substrate-binding protein
MVTAPVAVRLVDGSGLSRRNITGTSHVVPVADQLKAMRTYRPFSRLAVLYNPAESNAVLTLEDLRDEARRQAFTLIEEPVPLRNGQPDPQGLPAALERIAAKDPQFLYLGPDSFIMANIGAVTSRAVALGLPTFSAVEPPLRTGSALFGLVSRYYNLGRLTAHKAVQILREGRPPGTIPVETLSRFSLVIRMDVAQRLSFYPPLSMLDYAELIGWEGD